MRGNCKRWHFIKTLTCPIWSYGTCLTTYVYSSSETWLASIRDRAIAADYAICINSFSGPDIRKPREFYSINGILASR